MPTASLEAFRDSLALVTDTAAIRAAAGALSRQRDTSVSALLRRALLLLRLGALSDVREADQLCQRAAHRLPDSPYPLFCQGLAKEAYGSATALNRLNLGVTPGQGDIRRAADLYLAAIRREPSFTPAIFALGQLVLRWRGVERQAAALSALRSAVPITPGTPLPLLLVRARLERLAGEYDSAAAAFEAWDSGGGDHGVALLERARTLLGSGAKGADSLYYAGTAIADTAATAMYRNDLTLLVDLGQLRGFDSATGTARTDWLRNFWESRDILDLQPAGTRLREHYRRWLYAIQHFARIGNRRPTPFGSDPTRYYDSGRDDLDDRGIVWIRHGPPEMRITTTVIYDYPGESWRYLLPGADTLVLHFLDLHVANDFRLVPTVLGLEASPGDGRIGDLHSPLAMMETRAPLLPDYDRWLSASDLERNRIIRRDYARGDTALPRATTTDGNPVTFAHPLEIRSRAFVFGTQVGSPLVHLTFGVRIPDTAAWTTPTIRIGGYLTGKRVVGWNGPATASRSVQLNGVGWWVGEAAVPVSPGRALLRAALTTGDSTGTVTGWVDLDVPAAGTGLRLDGPLLAPALTALPWLSPAGDTAFFSPWSDFRPGEPAHLYAEVGGATPGDSVTVALSVTPAGRSLLSRLFGGRPAGITLKWEIGADRDVMPIARTLDLRQLAPGRYMVELAVTIRGKRMTGREELTIGAGK